MLHFGVHMLLDGDLRNPRNLITKISNYSKVSRIPKSFTVLEEFLPSTFNAALRGLTGSYDWTNPGVISHNEIIVLYRDYLHPEFRWQNYTEEEEAELMKAPRSNNLMHDEKMKRTFPRKCWRSSPRSLNTCWSQTESLV